MIPSLNPQIRSDLVNFVDSFEGNYSFLFSNEGTEALSPMEMEETEISRFESEMVDAVKPSLQEFNPEYVANLIDQVEFAPLTGRVARKYKEYEYQRRSRQLSEHLKSRENEPRFKEIRGRVASLPINSNRHEILDTIKNNQVTVISGETGCGKTTRVPSMILESFIEEGRGAEASILVTQPRRLPAISVAEQVAAQFGEATCGTTVGYHVRFEKKPPGHDLGAILFCTTGILLRKLVNNPNLSNVSHVIIDEVHERDVTTDLLLIFLKRMMKSNPKLRIILMSASINAKQFSDYFDNAPCLSISGMMSCNLCF